MLKYPCRIWYLCWDEPNIIYAINAVYNEQYEIEID